MGEAAGVAAGGSPGVTVLVTLAHTPGSGSVYFQAPPLTPGLQVRLQRSATGRSWSGLPSRSYGSASTWGVDPGAAPQPLWLPGRGDPRAGDGCEWTPGCGESWDPATRVKELLVDCSKPTEASVSGLLEKIWGMQKPTREKDSHCPPVSATAILRAWGREQDSLCLWPRGLVPDIKNKGNRFLIGVAWFYAHPQSWREGEVSDIDRGGGKAGTQR